MSYKFLGNLIILSTCCFHLFAQGPNQVTQNQITYPSNTYLMDNVDNYIYNQTMMRRWKPYDDFVRISCSGTSLKTQSGKRTIINKPVNGDTLRVDLINVENIDTVQTVYSIIKTGEPYKGDKAINVQFLGDSFTSGVYFRDAFIDSGYVPNVNLIGTRSISEAPGQAHEGRGGWSVYKYFSNDTSDPYFYNPYWQPKGKYRYWGSTKFWQNCYYVKTHKNIKEFDIKYFCSHYDLTFYSQEGKRLKPKKNDLMWDSDIKSYIRWNGHKWEKFKGDSLNWSFNYKKYLDMQELKKPEFLIFMFGLNDFRDGNLHPNFDLWDREVKEMIQSYKQAVPNGKFVICTPPTSCGVLNNQRMQFTIRQNAIMWEVRKHIIETFDNIENQGVYIVDACATIDNEHGFKEQGGMQYGNPHPYPNYPKLGIPIAAFVQYYRNK